MAAVLACGEGALLSHRSAATLHGLLNARGGRIHVTVPRRTSVARAGIHAHRSTCLEPRDRVEVEGIPSTSVPATLLTLAATAPRTVLDSACNRAELEGVLDMRAIGELLKRRRAHPGVSRLRAAVDVDGLGLDRTKSRLERRFLHLARETGLPPPTINAWMPISGEEMQCDFVWHRERLVVEIDAWETHRTKGLSGRPSSGSIAPSGGVGRGAGHGSRPRASRRRGRRRGQDAARTDYIASDGRITAPMGGLFDHWRVGAVTTPPLVACLAGPERRGAPAAPRAPTGPARYRPT